MSGSEDCESWRRAWIGAELVPKIGNRAEAGCPDERHEGYATVLTNDGHSRYDKRERLPLRKQRLPRVGHKTAHLVRWQSKVRAVRGTPDER